MIKKYLGDFVLGAILFALLALPFSILSFSKIKGHSHNVLSIMDVRESLESSETMVLIER